MTSIGLISDVHAAPEQLAEAMAVFAAADVEQILCAGDIAGYNDGLEATIKLLLDNACKTIMGNHDRLYLDHHEDEADTIVSRFLKALPDTYQSDVSGKSIYMVHAEPPDHCHGGIKLLDKHGELIPDKLSLWAERLKKFEHDVLIVGHTHQVYAEKLADTLVINPGSTVFNNSCAILRLPEMTVELIGLGSKAISKTWNWGEHVIYAQK